MSNKINESRTEKMKRKSMEELKAYLSDPKRLSLSAAAAEYEIQRRLKGGK